jgi:hypothetical protein
MTLMPNGSPRWPRGVVADHDPKAVPIPEYLGACYDAGLSWERIGMLLESLKTAASAPS